MDALAPNISVTVISVVDIWAVDTSFIDNSVVDVPALNVSAAGYSAADFSSAGYSAVDYSAVDYSAADFSVADLKFWSWQISSIYFIGQQSLCVSFSFSVDLMIMMIVTLCKDKFFQIFRVWYLYLLQVIMPILIPSFCWILIDFHGQIMGDDVRKQVPSQRHAKWPHKYHEMSKKLIHNSKK